MLITSVVVFLLFSPLYLLLGMAGLVAHHRAILWRIYGRRRFSARSVQLVERVAFLQKCGATRITALATILEDITGAHSRLMNPKKGRWDSPEAKAYEKLSRFYARQLVRECSNENNLIEDRMSGLKTLERHSKKQIGAFEGIVRHLQSFR